MEGAAVRRMTVLELSSREAWELDESTGEYRLVSEDVMPVSAQFNKLADDRNINPIGTPTITETHVVEVPGKRIIVSRVLCAVVMDRNEYAAMELGYREFMARIMASIQGAPVPTDGIVPIGDMPMMDRANDDAYTITDEPVRQPLTASPEPKRFTYPGVVMRSDARRRP